MRARTLTHVQRNFKQCRGFTQESYWGKKKSAKKPQVTRKAWRILDCSILFSLSAHLPRSEDSVNHEASLLTQSLAGGRWTGEMAPKEHNLWASCLHLEWNQGGMQRSLELKAKAFSEKVDRVLNEGQRSCLLVEDKPHQLDLILATRTENGHWGLWLTGQEITWAVLFAIWASCLSGGCKRDAGALASPTLDIRRPKSD